MAEPDNDNTGMVARGKVYPSPGAAIQDIQEGASLLIAGYAGIGWPEGLLRALANSGVGGLTCICQGTWPHSVEAADVSELVANGQVRKLISPLPFYPGSSGLVEDRWKSGELEIEVTPPGRLAERLRAGGAGLGGVFLPGAPGTRFQDGKETRSLDGKEYIFERALKADFALLRAAAADTVGNLVYRGSQRNWNPVMAMAGTVCIAEVDEIVEPGDLDPELVITPGIFVNRIVQTV